ncbi:MAG TPA: hypothetical protein VG602_03000 [Actinomycetota bacterium]|nr:hypothetical protein [Actinomycetota bacterium]
MRRLFWIGVGVAAAYYGSRWIRRKREQYSPAAVSGRAQATLNDLGKLLRVAVEEGRRAMVEKEAQIRSSLG